MSELNTRYQRGQEARHMFGGGIITYAEAMAATWELAPDPARILGEPSFSTLWHRDVLTLVQREMISLSTFIVQARELQLRRHLGNALNVGLTPEQIVELIIHDTWYSGAPAGLNALMLCKAVFDERGIAFALPRSHNSDANPDYLCERGDRFRKQEMGKQPGTQPVPQTQAERDFSRIPGIYVWVTMRTRPGLDLHSRWLCTITCLAALGREGPLRSHIRGALNIGFTQEQIIEVFLHMTLYGGIAFARSAIDIAHDIFIHG